MHHLAYCYACYMLGRDYHSGQASKGYLLLCLAKQRLRREHNYHTPMSMEAMLRKPLCRNQEFRNLVAYYLKKLRKYRKEL